MIIDTIFRHLEKLIRYVLPGFVFILFLGLFNPATAKYLILYLGSKEYYLYLPLLVGFIIYSLHRLLFEFVDYCIYWFNFEEIARTYRENQHINRGLSNYLYYKLAGAHFCLMLSELLIFFSFYYYSPDSFIYKYGPKFKFVAIILFIMSFNHYIFMHIIQDHIRSLTSRRSYLLILSRISIFFVVLLLLLIIA